MSLSINMKRHRAGVASGCLAVLLTVASSAWGSRNNPKAPAKPSRPSVERARMQLDEKALQQVVTQLNRLEPRDWTFDPSAIRKFYSEQMGSVRLDEKKLDLHIAVASALEKSAKSTGRPELLEMSDLAYSNIIRHTKGETKLRASSNYCAQRLRQNDPKKAVEIMEAMQASLDDPSLSWIARSRSLYNYGRALHLSGDLERAYDEFKKAAEVDPTFTKAAQAAGDVALDSSHESRGISKMVELTNKQLVSFDYGGTARNLRQALRVGHWIDNQFYPQLLGQLVRYFTAARIEPTAFGRDWGEFLDGIRKDERCGRDSRRMISGVRYIYAGRLKMASDDPMDAVNPEVIRDFHGLWERATNRSGSQSDLDFLSSFIKMVGDYYYRRGDPQGLEKSLVYYCHAWGLDVENMEAGLYLANVLLYDLKDGNRQLDQKYGTLNAFIHRLFESKNFEYKRDIGTDWERILKCHIILATIFEKQGRWGPESDPRTAQFQWNLAENALREVKKLGESASATLELLAPVVTEGLRNAIGQPAGARRVDFPAGSKTIHVTDFSTWPTASKEHGYARPEGGYYALEARSNTWVGPGLYLPIPVLQGDFIIEMSFKVIHKTNCSLHIIVSDAGDDYSQLDFYFSIWDSGSKVFSIRENWVEDNFYVRPRREIADRIPVPSLPEPIDWMKGNRLAVKREGKHVGFYFNGHLLQAFQTSVFDVKKVGIGLAHKSKVILTSLEARVPR